jgi:hypothetical protein
MTEHKEKWWNQMIATHGSEEAVRAFLRDSGNKAKRSKTGGFYKLSPEERTAAAKRGAEARWGNRAVKETTQSQN